MTVVLKIRLSRKEALAEAAGKRAEAGEGKTEHVK